MILAISKSPHQSGRACAARFGRSVKRGYPARVHVRVPPDQSQSARRKLHGHRRDRIHVRSSKLFPRRSESGEAKGPERRSVCAGDNHYLLAFERSSGRRAEEAYVRAGLGMHRGAARASAAAVRRSAEKAREASCECGKQDVDRGIGLTKNSGSWRRIRKGERRRSEHKKGHEQSSSVSGKMQETGFCGRARGWGCCGRGVGEAEEERRKSRGVAHVAPTSCQIRKSPEAGPRPLREI